MGLFVKLIELVDSHAIETARVRNEPIVVELGIGRKRLRLVILIVVIMVMMMTCVGVKTANIRLPKVRGSFVKKTTIVVLIVEEEQIAWHVVDTDVNAR